ncbi:MAG: potassium transporter Kup [Planctomycetes bacterium]|nr:potassium transporter Kup [Planctomycetota bacterium]
MTDASSQPESRSHLLGLCLASLGVVYGDIGTSPLYAIRECFHGEHAITPTPGNILGVLSLVLWSLTIVISLKYLVYVMRADNRGEGGVLALMALASRAIPGRRRTHLVVIMLGLFGAALLYGDGMITPAISVLGAMEGLEIAAPSFSHFVVPITVAVLVLLFLLQRRGTAGVGVLFGPVTLVWFAALSALGVWQIAHNPAVLMAISPHYAIEFLLHNQVHGLLVLGAVFLVVTGGEALYADMGHFGVRAIRLTWFVLVLPALLLNYFGQGALLLSRPSDSSNPFYRMAPHWALIPLLVLSTMAAIIASQAVISGAFSLTRQAMMLGYWPRMRVQHTSAKEIGQIYVPAINWILMVATIALVLGFGTSSNLAAAYGIAVTTTMIITTLLAYVVARYRWEWKPWACVLLTLVLLCIDGGFFAANVVKIEQGGWFPLAVAAGLFLLMTTWRKGRELLGKRLRESVLPIREFFDLMKAEPATRVPGIAVFMTGNPEGTPPALTNTFLHNHAVHKQVILLTIITEETPVVDEADRMTVDDLGEGFTRIIAHYGFMEDPDVPALLSRPSAPKAPLEHTSFFLGTETVLARRQGMSRWRTLLFSFLSRNAQRPTVFFNIPPDRVMEIGSQYSL